jgi:MFS family permease
VKNISRTVLILSLVSLFTDTASEMLYPVMPLFLKSIGFSVVLIGILEGLAEATAGLSKGYFGKLSDSSGKRLPFVRAGYALSAVSKPLMIVWIYPAWIFLARTADRLGKGLRTGARDAMLSEEATPGTKGTVFGFHRAMDTLGAVLGPSLALIYLHFYPEQYKTLFVIALFPGLLAVGATFLLKSKKKASPSTVPLRKISLTAPFKYWKSSSPEYKKLTAGLLLFAVVNSSDVFLLLKAQQSGISDTAVIGVYIFYNLVYALFSFPMGIMADKFGLKSVFIPGIILFAAVYVFMTMAKTIPAFLALFFLYGLYAAATEGISKAWISNVTEKKDAATALGSFAGFQSICALIASSLTGFIWFRFGSDTAFLITAVTAVGVALYLTRIPTETRPAE